MRAFLTIAIAAVIGLGAYSTSARAGEGEGDATQEIQAISKTYDVIDEMAGRIEKDSTNAPYYRRKQLEKVMELAKQANAKVTALWKRAQADEFNEATSTALKALQKKAEATEGKIKSAAKAIQAARAAWNAKAAAEKAAKDAQALKDAEAKKKQDAEYAAQQKEIDEAKSQLAKLASEKDSVQKQLDLLQPQSTAGSTAVSSISDTDSTSAVVPSGIVTQTINATGAPQSLGLTAQ